MATGALDPKRQAHEMIDRLSADQVSAVVGLLTTMLDPVDRAIASRSAKKKNAPSQPPRRGLQSILARAPR